MCVPIITLFQVIIVNAGPGTLNGVYTRHDSRGDYTIDMGVSMVFINCSSVIQYWARGASHGSYALTVFITSSLIRANGSAANWCSFIFAFCDACARLLAQKLQLLSLQLNLITVSE